jgi:hypothetical protein
LPKRSLIGDSVVTIGLGLSVAVSDLAPAPGALYQAVAEHFRATDIELPFPQQAVRLRSAA